MSTEASGCDNQFGGRISLNIGGVQFKPSDADITIKPTSVEVAADSNRDGSMNTTLKVVPFEADVKFRDQSFINWQNQMMMCSVDATIQELDNKRLHIFTSARLTGRPDYNTATGEVTGIVIKGPQYQKV